MAVGSDPADVFALLLRLSRLQLAWSNEGTMRAEAVVRRVAARYGADVEGAGRSDGRWRVDRK